MSRPTYISLFSSAGVGCYGFKINDFDCIATNELLPDRLAVQRANNKCKYPSGYIQGDITKPEVKEQLLGQLDYWQTHEHIRQVDVVFATPPCQGMSSVNYKKTDREQIRNSLVVEAIRLIDIIKPKIFVFENVRAFMKTICTDISGSDMSIKDSIYTNLGSDYNIFYKLINFKDYGVPSSRPRTIVIGTHKSIINISPLNLFPTRTPEITLRDAIGDLPSLDYSERDKSDPFHFARTFPEYMLPWITNLKEGESAFSNDDDCKPYKIDATGHRVILKGAYMGNKYRRLYWDKPGACIATRNDQLASQDTIHPKDNRVLSIRELMRLMTIPPSFKWTADDDTLKESDLTEYLRKNELNIRRCIGEAVPTHIVSQIAGKIKSLLQFDGYVNDFFDGRNPDVDESNFYIKTFALEQKYYNDKDKGSFYTPQSVVFNAIKHISTTKDIVKILEPSVGLGAFLPQVCSLFSECDLVDINAVEIDPETITRLTESLETLPLGSNVKVEFTVSDFLEHNFNTRFDYVFTNPPYAKSKKKYPSVSSKDHKTRNLFSLFLIHLHQMADEIVCVIPKNFLMADEFESVRNLYRDYSIVSVCDFGVKFFKKVFIEIISIHFTNKTVEHTYVYDFVRKLEYIHPEGYIYHDRVWLIYRDKFFDTFISKIKLGSFNVFRDRQITNSKVKLEGKIRVLKSKNILDDGQIVNIPGYDRYIDNPSEFAVSRFMNTKAILMPNFTYNTRATLLPENTIPNGSIAILIPKDDLTPHDLRFFASHGFRRYYSIVKSYSRFTLNIDNCSLYYIGPHNE